MLRILAFWEVEQTTTYTEYELLPTNLVLAHSFSWPSTILETLHYQARRNGGREEETWRREGRDEGVPHLAPLKMEGAGLYINFQTFCYQEISSY
jgi:hypothetical protein